MQKKRFEIPPSAAGIIAVLLAGSAAYYFFVYKPKKDKEKEEKKGSQENLNAVSQEIQILTQNNKPSYSPAQYSSWANAIFTACDGYATDEDAIYDVFKNMKIKLDVLELIKAFDIRTVSSGAWSLEPDVTGDLPTVLTSELKASEKKVINDDLQQKGIDYKF